jgi:hypothetical protein
MVSFKFNPNQQILFERLQEQYKKEGKIRIIILKSRRVGMSSLTEGLLWTYSAAFANKNSLIVAHLAKSSEDLFRVPRDLSKACPGFAADDIQQKKIRFPHPEGDSFMSVATAGTPSAGRGGTLSALHLSEAAYFPSDEAFTSLITSVSKGADSIVIIESTANGREGPGEAFCEYWDNAVAGRNGYIPVFLSWLDDPMCIRPAEEAEDAPADDLERELMAKPYGATKEQIAWCRRTKSDDCRDDEVKWLVEFPHCLFENTLVSTGRGVLPICEVKVGDTTAYGIVTAVIDQGIQKLWHLHTKDGRHLIGTSDHPMILESGDVSELSKCRGKRLRLAPPIFSEFLYTLRTQDICNTHIEIPITPELARFLGYFMGDGCYSRKQVSIACDGQDGDVIEDVIRLFDLFLGTHQIHTGNTRCVEMRVSRPAFPRFLEALNIWSDCPPHRRVKVPDCIFRSPKFVVREFLSGLFEADGTVAYPDATISLSAKKREFLQDVQLLLLGFGITSRIRLMKHKTKPNYDCYSLSLRTEESALFHHEVGFIGKRKRDRAIRPNFKGWWNKTLPIEMVDTVTQVRPLNSGRVYDITVEGGHTFSASGILVHNCPSVAFQVSGSPVFPREELAYAQSTVRPPIARGRFARDSRNQPMWITDDRGPWHIWEFPKDEAGKSLGHKYYSGADAALGTETGDFASITVFDGTNGMIAARFAERVPPEELANQMDMSGRFYDRAMVNPELTGNLGRWALVKLRDIFFYPNIYAWKGRDDKKRGKSHSMALGFEMNQATRRLIIDAMRSRIRLGMRKEPGGLIVNDAMLMSQMSLATVKEWRWEILRGHDDVFVSAAIAILTCEQYPPARMKYATKVLESAIETKAIEGIQVKSEMAAMIQKEADLFMRRATRKQRDRLQAI